MSNTTTLTRLIDACPDGDDRAFFAQVDALLEGVAIRTPDVTAEFITCRDYSTPFPAIRFTGTDGETTIVVGGHREWDTGNGGNMLAIYEWVRGGRHEWYTDVETVAEYVACELDPRVCPETPVDTTPFDADGTPF